MRRWMFLLSLIAVLTGTHLRLAEAAEDLGRSLAELDHGVNLEEVDGGVGDDSGATIKTDAPEAGSPSGPVDFLTTLTPLVPPPVECGDFRPADSIPRIPLDPARRRAWLQCCLC